MSRCHVLLDGGTDEFLPDEGGFQGHFDRVEWKALVFTVLIGLIGVKLIIFPSFLPFPSLNFCLRMT